MLIHLLGYAEYRKAQRMLLRLRLAVNGKPVPLER